jgi:TPR repeat protein
MVAPANLDKQYERALALMDQEKAGEALPLLEECAECGHLAAQFMLSTILRELGKHEAANQWLMHAAEHGSIDAQYELGMLYESGCGLDKNDEQALFWYRKAATAGNALAADAVARLE